MLRLERQGRSGGVGIAFRSKESLWTKGFMLALGAALFFHLFFFSLFSIAKFKFSFGAKAVQPTKIVVEWNAVAASVIEEVNDPLVIKLLPPKWPQELGVEEPPPFSIEDEATEIAFEPDLVGRNVPEKIPFAVLIDGKTGDIFYARPLVEASKEAVMKGEKRLLALPKLPRDGEIVASIIEVTVDD